MKEKKRIDDLRERAEKLEFLAKIIPDDDMCWEDLNIELLKDFIDEEIVDMD